MVKALIQSLKWDHLGAWNSTILLQNQDLFSAWAKILILAKWSPGVKFQSPQAIIIIVMSWSHGVLKLDSHIIAPIVPIATVSSKSGLTRPKTYSPHKCSIPVLLHLVLQTQAAFAPGLQTFLMHFLQVCCLLPSPLWMQL